MDPASRRQAVEAVIEKLGVSERQACKTLGQNRNTQRYEPKMPAKDHLLTEAIREQANKRKHRRYGYRRITEILCILGWIVNHKRVYRIWRQGDLRIPQKRGRKKHHNGNGLNACDRHPPEYMNHIWSYDTMEDKLENGRKVRILNVIDEFTRECLASEVGFSIKQHDVIELLRYRHNLVNLGPYPLNQLSTIQPSRGPSGMFRPSVSETDVLRRQIGQVLACAHLER